MATKASIRLGEIPSNTDSALRRLIVAGGMGACAILATPALAQDAEPAAAPAPVAAPAPTPDRDPEAMAALEKMGAALRKLEVAEVHSDVTTEEVLTSGQKLQFGGTTTLFVQRPDKLRATIHSARRDREIFYNGKTLTIFAPNLGFFASFPAPGTIRETIDFADSKYDIAIPLFELADWGTDPKVVERVQTAFRVGADSVNGKVCTHYAVRQPAIDWQVWLDEAGSGLPCKLVVTNRDDPAMPQYTAVYTWVPAKAAKAASFTFSPPKGTHEIAIATMPDDAAAAAKGDK